MPHDPTTTPATTESSSPGTIDIVLRGIDILQGYRRFILGLTGLSLLIATVAVVWIFVTQPRRTTALLPFRLEFDGATAGRYPSGMAFSLQDIVSAPVLLKVYQVNRLADYLKFEEFAGSFFVQPSSPEADLLALEYRAKLADPRLSPPERSGLEKEYLGKLASVQYGYAIVWVAPADATPIDSVQLSKALNDVLVEWADQSVRRGAVAFATGPLGEAIFDQADRKDLDIAKRADALRLATARLRDNIASMMNLPGARVTRSRLGNVSLPELQARVDELLRTDLSLPGIAAALQATPSSIRHFEDQRTIAQREYQRALGRRKAIEDALMAYSTSGAAAGASLEPGTASGSVAQLGESFLDRVIQMSGGIEDQKYRQQMASRLADEATTAGLYQSEIQFYDSVLENLRRPGTGNTVDGIAKDLDAARAKAATITKELASVFEVVNESLNPRRALYSLAGGFASGTSRPYSPFTLLQYLLVVALVVPLTLSAACLLHGAGRHFLGLRKRRA